MDLIPLSHYEDSIPDRPGTVNIDHEDCPAGTDTRARLYITRKNNGDVLVYCHNCSGRGFRKVSTTRNIYDILDRSSGEDSGHEDGYSLPKDVNPRPETWPNEARRWVSQYGITTKEMERHNLYYSPFLRRVVLPVYDKDWEIIGYQSRRIYESDPGPKYLTQLPRKTSGVFSSIGNPRGSKIVLVEDTLSAIKVGVSTDYDAVACLGGDVKPERLVELSDHYDNVVVFLDNDNAQIKKAQGRAYAQCRNIFKGSTQIVYGDKDPKEYSRSDLKRLLDSTEEVIKG